MVDNLLKRVLDEKSDCRHLLLLTNAVNSSEGLFLDGRVPVRLGGYVLVRY